jgi:hypothetical protein
MLVGMKNIAVVAINEVSDSRDDAVTVRTLDEKNR